MRLHLNDILSSEDHINDMIDGAFYQVIKELLFRQESQGLIDEIISPE